MKKMKKLFALLLTFAMVMGMTVTAMAAEGKPVPGNTAQATVENLQEGVTVNLYRIVEPTYNDLGFTGYKLATGVTLTDMYAPTSQEIKELAANTSLLNSLPDEDKATVGPLTGTTMTAQLGAGTWLVLVDASNVEAAKVYNPMIVSVYYDVNGSGQMNELQPGDIVDANKNWELKTDKAFAKSSTIPFDKKLQNPEFDTKVKVGDSLPYEITGMVPSYAKEYYPNAKYIVTDNIVNGIKYDAKPVVKVGDTTLTEGTEYTLEYDPATSFKVTLTQDFIWSLANAAESARAVSITYTATVQDSAVKYIGENKATLEYREKPGTDTNGDNTKEDKEYVFTFALNGIFKKTGEGDDANGLKDAEFTLYRPFVDGTDAENSKETLTWATDDDRDVVAIGTDVSKETTGEFRFKGLDGESDYYLRETAAPDKYSINDTIYHIQITTNPASLSGKYNGENPVPDYITYTVTVTNNKNNETKTYTVEYNLKDRKDNSGSLIEIEDDFGNTAVSASGKTVIPNTKLSNLPSTGGIGTTIFTVGGCAIMIIAAALFFASRKKSQK